MSVFLGNYRVTTKKAIKSIKCVGDNVEKDMRTMYCITRDIADGLAITI